MIHPLPDKKNMDQFPEFVEKEEKVNFVYDFLVDSTHTMLVIIDSQHGGSGKTMAVDEAICLLEKKYGTAVFQPFRIHHFADDQKFALYNTVTAQLKIISYVGVWNDAWSYVIRDWEAKVAVFKYDGDERLTPYTCKAHVFTASGAPTCLAGSANGET
jgi:hypothetical protein